jgi:hypothetical protein
LSTTRLSKLTVVFEYYEAILIGGVTRQVLPDRDPGGDELQRRKFLRKRVALVSSVVFDSLVSSVVLIALVSSVVFIPLVSSEVLTPLVLSVVFIFVGFETSSWILIVACWVTGS